MSSEDNHGNDFELFKGTTSFIYNDKWDFIESSGLHRTIIAMYFALTSLSTTGFGDYYP